MGKRKPPSPPRSEATPARTPSFLASQAYWLLPFALFLVVRLFCGDPYYLLAGDQCTFLQLGRTFPKHQLFNQELYLIHSPLLGYAVGLVHLVLPLLASGLVASLAFAVINFFAIRALGQVENLPPAAVSLGLVYLALSRPAVAYDYHVARVSILVCATALAFLAFLRLLRDYNRQMLLHAMAANAFALLVSDQALLLLPCEALLFWLRAPQRQWRPIAQLAAVSAVAALIWPAVRLFEFLHRPHLPAGISGTIEFTRNFPWMAIVQPNFLPFTNTQRSLFTQTSLSLANLKPALLANLPTDLLLIPQSVAAVLVLLLMAAALASRDRRKRALIWLSLSLVFLLPVGVGMNEWYGMTFLVPFALLMMEGAAAGLSWAGRFVNNSDRKLMIALSAACALAAIAWLTAGPPGPHIFLFPRGGRHFLFNRPAVTRAASMTRFLESAPRTTGIMAPTDLTPEVVYLTDKRVVALPFDPALLEPLIRDYDISYILTSSEFFQRYDSPIADRYTSAEVNRYIGEHPERYRLVQRQREDYPAFYPPTEYYLFQVVKGQ